MWKQSLFAFLGAMFGIAFSQFAGPSLQKPASRIAIASPSSAPEAVAPKPSPDIQLQIDSLRQQLNRQNLAPAASASSAPASVSSAEEPPTPSELHKRALSDFAREGIDSTWAPQTEKSISKDLSNSGSGGLFDVQSVTCHTTTCVANIEFANFTAAQRNWGHVLATNYESRCGTEVLLDDAPHDKTQRFGTQVVFNCEGVRAGD